MGSNQFYLKGRRGEWLLRGFTYSYDINSWEPVRGGSGRSQMDCEISSCIFCHFCFMKLYYGLTSEIVIDVCHHGGLYPSAS